MTFVIYPTNGKFRYVDATNVEVEDGALVFYNKGFKKSPKEIIPLGNVRKVRKREE